MPKVSVVMPIYNAETYLDECMSSVVHQTLEDIEIICVNDGSTDSSLDILRGFARSDARITIIDKANGGYGESMNRGCDSATGEYLTILESDDYLPSDACETMYDFAKDNGDLDFLKADARLFYGEGDARVYSPAPASPFDDGYNAVFSPADDPGRFPNRSGQPALYRLSFLRDHRIRFHETPGASFQDTGFWAQVMFCARKARFLDRITYMIRRDNPNSSESDTGKVYCICSEYDFIRRKVDELPGINQDLCARSCAYFRFQGYLWNCSRIASPFVREFLERASGEYRELDRMGELDLSYFSDGEREILTRILENPDAYYFESYHYRDQIGALNSRIAQLEQENERLRATAEAERSEKDEVYASHSFRLGWTLTAPARALRRMTAHDDSPSKRVREDESDDR